MPAANHVFTVFSLFAFTSASVPLTWHLTEASSWNAGTCLFIFWTGLSSLVWFVNSIVWDGNVVNWTPVWCDICEFHSPAAFMFFPPFGVLSDALRFASVTCVVQLRGL